MYHSKVFGNVVRDCCFGWSDNMIFRYLLLTMVSDKYLLLPIIKLHK